MTDLIAHAATAVALGQRMRQEDAVLASFPQGADVGLVVLSDGMGGHDDGHLASRIIVSEMFGALLFSSAYVDRMRTHAPELLKDALSSANYSIRAHTDAGSGQPGMGGTVISAVLMDDAIRWISVGDSMLYLFREGTLTRLNQDHSMGARIDYMVEQGMMDAESARTHPQRNCLTSALTGQAVELIDCPSDPLALHDGDIVLLASDGLNGLDRHHVCGLVAEHAEDDPNTLVAALVEAVAMLDDPEQDNLSIAAIKMSSARMQTSAIDTPSPQVVESALPREPAQIGLVARLWRRWQGGLSRQPRSAAP